MDTVEGAVKDTDTKPCPYVQRSDEGTAFCSLAETGIKVFERRAKDAEQDAEGWKRELQMYAEAWQRELGGKLRPKTHLIDALVLTTRRMCEDLYHALRLGLEGTDEDRAMYLRRMAARYPHVEGLKELAAKYRDPLGILRQEANTDSRGVKAARFAEQSAEAQKEK